MGSVITSSNIESQAYSNLLEVLDNRSNVADPRSSGMTNAAVQKRPFVYDSDPFERAINFSDMPYIILELPVLEDVEESHSMDGKYENRIWRHRIIVRTKREGSSNVLTDRGRTDMLAIGDDLQETFKSRTVRDALAVFNMRSVVLEKLRTASFALDNSKDIYESEYQIEYSTRIQVSD